jgi:hypothetical protein
MSRTKHNMDIGALFHMRHNVPVWATSDVDANDEIYVINRNSFVMIIECKEEHDKETWYKIITAMGVGWVYDISSHV